MIRLALVLGLGACSMDASGLEKMVPTYDKDAGTADRTGALEAAREMPPADLGPEVAPKDTGVVDMGAPEAPRAGWPGGAKCNPIANTGCTTGSCYVTCQSWAKGVQCGEVGPLLPTAACDESTRTVTGCVAGAFCYNGTADIGPGICHQLCETDGDCPSKRCRIKLPCTMGVPVGAGLCEF